MIILKKRLDEGHPQLFSDMAAVNIWFAPPLSSGDMPERLEILKLIQQTDHLLSTLHIGYKAGLFIILQLQPFFKNILLPLRYGLTNSIFI